MNKQARQELIAATQAYEASLGVKAAVPAAQDAFKYEVVYKMLRPILENCQQEIMDVMRDIQNGKFPKEQYAYGVMRHMPMSMTEPLFLKELMKAFLRSDLRRGLKALVQDARP